MSNEPPILIESIRRLDVRPGDTLVLQLGEQMTLQQIAHIREQWIEQTKHLNVKAIVLGPHMEVTILSDAERDELRRQWEEPIA